jgi:hypothetical protein
MKKKGLFAILAVLAVFALVMTGCDTGGGTTKYTVTFDVNGGGGTAPAAQTVTAGQSVTLPGKGSMTAPADKPYFGGWSETAAGTALTGATYKPNSNQTLFAVWSATAVSAVVKFDKNGGGGTAPASIEDKNVGDTISLPGQGEMTAPTGKYFDGWSETSTGATLTGDTWVISGPDVTLYAVWKTGVAPGPAPIPVEEFSLANAWFAIYEIKLPAGKTWGDYDSKLTVDYKFDETNLLGSEARAVRLMGQYIPEEVANPRLGKYTPEDGTPSYVATVGNWPSGTSNEWIMATLASWGAAGSTPDKLSPWTYPTAETDIVADEWFTIWYPVTGVALDAEPVPGVSGTAVPEANWNKSCIGRLPQAADTGPFYFGVGVPGNTKTNTFQMTNVTLKGKGDTADAVGRPLYYTKDSQKFRALAGNMQDPGDDGLNTNMNGGLPGWKIISGEDGIVTKAAPTTEETVTITFNAQGGSATAALTVRKGEMVTHAQLGVASTKAGNKLLGWFTAATGGDKVSAATYFKICTGNVTYFAQWEALPDATTDVVVDMTTLKVSSFGGLGSLDTNAGLGPFNYKADQQYDAAIWFAYPTEINTYIYDHIEVVVTLAKITDSGDSTKDSKLAVHNGRADNSWSGGTSVYFPSEEVSTDDGDVTIELPIASTGIVIQHNKYGGTAEAPATADFTLTLKSIKLVAPTE